MNILAINPWIYDFAAYDFWLKPYGFLVLLSYLKKNGLDIDYIDCLNKRITCDNFGRGKYYSQIIPKPEVLRKIPRYFKRYGITLEELDQHLQNKHPELLLTTSSMTYWYPAIKDLIKILKMRFVNIPVGLGGTYATLCSPHAKETTLADYIFSNENLNYFFEWINVPFNFKQFYTTLPEYEYFYSHLDYIVLRTSWGCPFTCKFCAIKKLFPGSLRIPPHQILDFLSRYATRGIKNFILYDDALLYPQQEAKELFKKIAALDLKISFHTPNAIHLKFLDQEMAFLLKKIGFVNPHFGLETLNPRLQKFWGDKANTEDFIEGITYLKKAGFRKGEFSIYLLLGHPDQKLGALKKDIEFIHSQGARVSLAEFSPVPGTEIFNTYTQRLTDPLLHNNSIFPFLGVKSLKEIYHLKNFARTLNKTWEK
jgi:radical SAM superfamily enzyme YgiQ (UPF0313 family)